MKTRALWALLVGGSILVTGGCATSEQWGEWRTHTSHFASERHLGFSMRNDNQGANPRVSRTDLASAQTENWWGNAITVQSNEIFQN
jgi:hypothetical protein